MKQLTFIMTVMLSLHLWGCSKSEEEIVYPTHTDLILADIPYGPHEQNKMDILLPAGRDATTTKVLVLIHGGGWIAGDKSDFNSILDTENIEYLKKEFPDMALFLLNYRLALSTDSQYPAAENDIKAAMDFIYRHAKAYQVNGNAVYLLGGSAGAHLAALYALKSPTDRIKGVIGISGPYDLPMLYLDGNDESRNILRTFMGGTPQEQGFQYFNASPYNFVHPVPTKFLLLHGRQDKLVPLSQAQKLEAALKEEGVEVKTYYYDGEHGIPPQHIGQSIEEIKKFLK